MTIFRDGAYIEGQAVDLTEFVVDRRADLVVSTHTERPWSWYLHKARHSRANVWSRWEDLVAVNPYLTAWCPLCGADTRRPDRSGLVPAVHAGFLSLACAGRCAQIVVAEQALGGFLR